MHTAIALLRQGYRVGTIDLDARQGTLTRYLKKRFDFVTRSREPLPCPVHMPIERSAVETMTGQRTQEDEFLKMALGELAQRSDFIIIDTPGTDCYLSRIAHSHADTLITPMNDSFIDLDLFADVDMKNYEILGPSVYTRMVEEQRRVKRDRGDGEIDWIVTRNRIAPLNTNNNKVIAKLLERIAELANFRLCSGFGERVVFKEMFLKGLTLMDLHEEQDGGLTLSQLTARQEVRNLINTIGPERIIARAAA